MDWDKINALLQIVLNATAAGPKFKWVGDAAERELHDMNRPTKTPSPVFTPTEFDRVVTPKAAIRNVVNGLPGPAEKA